MVGYSRAVRVGNLVFVSGTTAINADGAVVGVGNPYEQTKFVIQKVDSVLREAGCNMRDVVRTRIFVTDIECWQEVGRAHHEFFADIRPCATMVQVAKLTSPELLVEIEVDAVRDSTLC